VERGLLIDLWGTIFWPKLPLEEYHRLRARKIWESLGEAGRSLSFEAVYEAYIAARRLADAIRTTTHAEVNLTAEMLILLDKLGIEPDLDTLRRLEEAYVYPYLTHLVVAEGVADLIRTARERGFKVILASNTASGKASERLLREHGLLCLFDYLAFSDEIGFRKPHPRFFSVIVRETGIVPSRSLFVGDEEADIAGAKNFGMKAVAFTGFHDYDGSTTPDATARTMAEVAEMLAGSSER